MFRLSSKIRDPYLQLLEYTQQLENLQITSELLRKLQRFMLLRRRLEAQLSTNEQDITTAAMTLYELKVIMEEADFEGIDVVTVELPFITKSRERVEEEALVLLKDGIETQNQTKMASGLQVFYNMKQMGDRVQTIVQSMLDGLLEQIKKVVDLPDVQAELRKGMAVQQAVSSPTLATRKLNNEINLNQKDIAAAVWTRMEKLMQNMSDQCIKIYSLEKVLDLKKDPLTHMAFLEEIAKVIKSFEKNTK